jgi:hypothetical protein
VIGRCRVRDEICVVGRNGNGKMEVGCKNVGAEIDGSRREQRGLSQEGVRSKIKKTKS